MEKTKERRIRKLRKKRIWPSIIGLFFILGMIMIAVSGEMLTLISNIVNRELMYGYRLSEKVAKSAEVVLKDETKSPEEMMKLIEYMMDEVKAVCKMENFCGQAVISSRIRRKWYRELFRFRAKKWLSM